jgi:hypothetical protein
MKTLGNRSFFCSAKKTLSAASIFEQIRPVSIPIPEGRDLDDLRARITTWPVLPSAVSRSKPIASAMSVLTGATCEALNASRYLNGLFLSGAEITILARLRARTLVRDAASSWPANAQRERTTSLT